MTSDESLRPLEHRLYHGDNNAHTAVPRSDGDGAEKARPAQRLGRHGQAVERMRLPELTVRPCCLLSAALAESLQRHLLPGQQRRPNEWLIKQLSTWQGRSSVGTATIITIWTMQKKGSKVGRGST